MTKNCHLSLLDLACVAYLSLASWVFLCVSVSEKPWRDTLYTGLRAKHHLEMTTAIAPISTSSSGATGTGEPCLLILTSSYLVLFSFASSEWTTYCCNFYFPSLGIVYNFYDLTTSCSQYYKGIVSNNTKYFLPGTGHTNPITLFHIHTWHWNLLQDVSSIVVLTVLEGKLGNMWLIHCIWTFGQEQAHIGSPWGNRGAFMFMHINAYVS